MDGNIIDSVTIEFEDPEELKRKIKNGKAEPVEGIYVRPDDGRTIDPELRIGTELTSLFCGILFNVDHILAGEKCVYRTEGPLPIVIEPYNATTVNFVLCDGGEKSVENPEQRQDFEPTALIEKRAFIESWIDGGEELLTMLQDLHPNPDAQNSYPESSIKYLRKYVTTAKEQYRDAYGPLPDE